MAGGARRDVGIAPYDGMVIDAARAATSSAFAARKWYEAPVCPGMGMAGCRRAV